MKFHKTRKEERSTYCYTFVSDVKGGSKSETITITPGEFGVTEAHIEKLHVIDDSEVYYNIKNCKPKLTESQENEKNEWEDEHPGEEWPKNWNVSIDAFDSSDKLKILEDSKNSIFVDESPEIERLHEVISTLSEDQKELYKRVYINEERQVDIAADLGISKQALQSRINKIKNHIKKNY